MSKTANAGELRTPVMFMQVSRETDKEGIPCKTERNVFGEGEKVLVKWVNAHGTDTFTALQLQLREPATITMRYSPLVNVKQIVYKGDDPDSFEIISIDNVEESNKWLEIKVQRKETAR